MIASSRTDNSKPIESLLDAEGEKRGRRYRLSTEFLRKAYGGELPVEWQKEQIMIMRI
jgi:hypothetical protein